MAAVTPTYSALAVAEPVRPFFEASQGSGRVLAAFPRSCYVETQEGQLIAVLAESLGRGAFALTVAGEPSFAWLQTDDSVLVADQVLELGPLRIGLGSAAPWDPTLPAFDGPPADGMRVLGTYLRANAPAEGLSRILFDIPGAPAATPLDRAGGALDRLRAGLIQGDASAVTSAATDLAGFGPGLTPSGDDVLAGILLALGLWPQAAGPLGAKVVSTLIVGAAAPRTGRISRAYLWAARRGHAAEAWHDLVRALPTDLDGVIAAASRILQTGETSGADMLAGFVFAWQRP